MANLNGLADVRKLFTTSRRVSRRTIRVGAELEDIYVTSGGLEHDERRTEVGNGQPSGIFSYIPGYLYGNAQRDNMI